MSQNLASYFKRGAPGRVTAEDFAGILGVTRATITRRNSAGYDAGDVIRLARHYGISPTQALTDLGYLDLGDVVGAVNGGLGVATATDVQLLEELLGRAHERESAGWHVTGQPDVLGLDTGASQPSDDEYPEVDLT